MSKGSILIIFSLAIFTLVTNEVCAEPPTEPNFVYAACETEFGNYTTNSAYDRNFKTVLTTLLKQANSSSMFYNTSAGTGPDTVYGQYYCRGDISSELCGQCFLLAAGEALVKCPQAKAAVVYLQECTLHYENQTLFGVESINPGALLYTPNSTVTDPTSFSSVINSTIHELMIEAESATNKFATGEGTVSATETVYCLVQCSPDLNAAQCESCLVSAAGVGSTCCGQWPSILYVFLPSCQMMYNTRGAFYSDPSAPPSPPAVSSTPPPSLDSVRITLNPAKP